MGEIKILGVEQRALWLQARMPFRYGIATMTRVPHLFLEIRMQIDGAVARGVAADMLPPKWFTKDPHQAAQDEIAEMLRVISHAAQWASGRVAEDVFSLWHSQYLAQDHWSREQQIPPLLAQFGTSLIERASIDAFCRGSGTTFHRALQANLFGVRLASIHPELTGTPKDYLPAAPLNSIIVRHTVGLSDPLCDEEIAAADKLEDGLPQSLEASIRAYRLRHFKIKVNGDLDRDLDRLERIARILERVAGSGFRVSIDGNEQFGTVEAFATFWHEVSRRPGLASLVENLLFVEQPLHRDVALSDVAGRQLRNWTARPPTIIDESDATLHSLPRALESGYAGTSHKNCKGIFKSVANRCLLAFRARSLSEKEWIMSGEDLSNVGPVALPQDLAVAAALHIASVERNGHHYFRGLSPFSKAIQSAAFAAHPDLYVQTPAGWPTLAIEDGEISVGTINRAPFGVAFEMPFEDLPSLSAL